MDAAKLRTLVDAARYDEAELLRQDLAGQPAGELAFQVARLLVKTGRAADSGRYFLAAVQSDGADPGWVATAVDVLIQNKCPAQARAVADWGVSRAPDDPRYLLLQGKACSACRDDDAARQALERCCAKDPEIEQAQRTLGLVYLRAGLWAEADAALLRAGTLVPSNLTVPSYLPHELLESAAAGHPTPWISFQIARNALEARMFAQAMLRASQVLEGDRAPLALRAGACEILGESARRSLGAGDASRALREILARHADHAPGGWVHVYRALLDWNEGRHGAAAAGFALAAAERGAGLIEAGAFTTVLGDSAAARARHFAFRRSQHMAVTAPAAGRSLVLLQACRPQEIVALSATLTDPLAKWGHEAIVHIHVDGFVGDVEALLAPVRDRLGAVPLSASTTMEMAPTALSAAYLAAPTVLGAYKVPVLINGAGKAFGSGAPVALDTLGMADFALRFLSPGRLALPWQLSDPRAAYFRPSADAFQLLGDVAEWLWDAVARNVSEAGLLERAIGYAWARRDPLAVAFELPQSASAPSPGKVEPQRMVA
jgi:hypothetical protein